MSTSVVAAESQNYFVQLFVLLRLSIAQLFRAPTHARRPAAARRLGRHSLLLAAVTGAFIAVSMMTFDVTEIGLMPPRGSPGLWWARILTDFGKDSYVMAALFAALVVVAIACPFLQGLPRARLLRLGTHLQYVFVAVACSNLVAEVLNYAIGRGLTL